MMECSFFFKIEFSLRRGALTVTTVSMVIDQSEGHILRMHEQIWLLTNRTASSRCGLWMGGGGFVLLSYDRYGY